MKNNAEINIKDLWNGQTVPEGNSSKLFKEISRFRRRGMGKVILLNILLLLTIFFVVFVWIYFKPQLITTKIGILLSILPVCMVLVCNCRLLPLYKRIDESSSNFDYLNDLLAISVREEFMHTKIMNIYFVLLSSGIGLYMFEYVVNGTWISAIAKYASFLLWCAFNWFVLRPLIIKKNRRKREGLIKQVERIKRQLK